MMNIGDYVRTIKGKIYKLTENDLKFEMTKQNCKISSPNITDLLKKDDLVVDYNDNIYKVNKIYKGYVFTDKKNKYGQVITLVDYQIKYIVTHEQFSQMEYKVE